jgi:hypothetical protein
MHRRRPVVFGLFGASRGWPLVVAVPTWRRHCCERNAEIDAVHVGVAAVNGIEYLLTWNLRHLANAVLRGKIEEAVRAAGLVPPIICTPEELMEPKP